MSREENTTQTTICRFFPFRRNVRGWGRTEYIVFSTVTYEQIRPVKIQRSKTGAHGFDIYCLSESEWKNTAIIRLEVSNTGKLSYSIQSPVRLSDLEEQLMRASSFNHMKNIISNYLASKRGENESTIKD
jgi:hypothetical protein